MVLWQNSFYLLSMTKKINAIIIEDEQNSLQFLKNMLTRYCGHVDIIGCAEDVSTGIHLVNKYQPELVFLDIEMPGGNGFDILDRCQGYPFKVIFVTGYDHYAIKYAAFDYILKPINLEELEAAVARVARATTVHTHNSQ